MLSDYDKDTEEDSGFFDREGNCGACSYPDCGCSCDCGICPPKDYSMYYMYYEEPDVDELQENQDFAQDDDYRDYRDECDD